MKKALLLAEKPSLCRDVKRVYEANRDKIPYEITCMPMAGHLVRLKTPKEMNVNTFDWNNLPFHPENHGGYQYVVIESSKNLYDAIAKELQTHQYDCIINCGDADQEGELLARLTISKLGWKGEVLRLWANATTDAELLAALMSMKDDLHTPLYVNNYNAALVRQISDYSVGMSLSSAVTLKANARVAVGRVKSTILALVAKQKLAYDSFKPTVTYGVEAQFAEGFKAVLVNPNKRTANEKEDKEEEADTSELVSFDMEEKAIACIHILANTGTVASVTKKEERKYSPKLFKLSTMQGEAGKYGINPERTQKILQDLYEKHLMSYPRTDCEYLGSEMDFRKMLSYVKSVPDLAFYVDQITDADIERVRKNKRWIDDDALKNSGHYALVPSSAATFSQLSSEEQTIYRLACRQFLAMFLPQSVYEKTRAYIAIDTKDGRKCYFRTNGRICINPGYEVVMDIKSKDNILPPLSENMRFSGISFETCKRSTQPPKLFTDDELILVLESPGKYLEDESLRTKELTVGRPSTRMPILKTLLETDKYLTHEKVGRRNVLVPTPLGFEVYNAIKDQDVSRVDMTGEWELKFTGIRNGTYSPSAFKQEIDHYIDEQVAIIKNSNIQPFANNQHNPNASTTEEIKCPCCATGKIRPGKKAYFCTNYEKCGNLGIFLEIMGAKISQKDAGNLCSGNIITKELTKKDGTKWKQKLRYNTELRKVEFAR